MLVAGPVRGAPRRGRGVPRARRSGQPRVPGRDAAQRDDVRPARLALRLLHATACTGARTRCAGRERRRTRCCCARPRRSPGSTSCASGGSRRGATATSPRAGQPRSGVRVRPVVRRRRPHARSGPHRRRRHAAARRARRSPCASGSARGQGRRVAVPVLRARRPAREPRATGSGRGSSRRRAPSPPAGALRGSAARRRSPRT